MANLIARTVGEVRRALEGFTDECPLTDPVEVIVYPDLVNGTEIELYSFVEGSSG